MEKAYSIRCCTGCTCCSDENHYYGFFTNKEDAETQTSKWRNGDGNPLASQYARYGRYYVEDHSYEKLPDGRVIIDGQSVYSVEDQSSWPCRLGQDI